MAVHVEWLVATETRPEIAQPGTRIGLDRLGPNRFGLVLNYDEVVVIEGTLQELNAFAADLTRAIAESTRAHLRNDPMPPAAEEADDDSDGPTGDAPWVERV